MSQDVRELFKGVGKAKPMFDSNWLRPVYGIFRIDNTKIDKNRNDQTRAFIEMTCVHVFDPMLDDLLMLKDKASAKPHKPGEAVTVSFKKEKDQFSGEVAGFICAVLDMDLNSTSEEEKIEAAATVFGGENPLEGTLVEVSAKIIMTKKNEPFTKIIFKGEVDPSSLKEYCKEETLKMLFPGDQLDNLIKAYNETKKA